MNFFTKYQKLIFLIIFVLTTLLLGFLIYKVFFKSFVPENPDDPKITTTTPGGGLPSAGEGDGGNIVTDPGDGTELPTDRVVPPTEKKIDDRALGGVTKTTTISELPSSNVTMSKDGKDLQYYNKQDGKFYKIDSEGKIVSLSDKVFHNVEDVTWSPQKNKAVLEYPDGANIVYDFDTEKQVSLPKHWEDFDFSTTGSNIVAKSIGLDPHNRWLVVSDSGGTNSQKIEMIGINAGSVQSSWSPNNQIIATHIEGVDFNRQKVYFVGKNNENFKSLTVEGRDFKSIWSNKGDKLLYSVYSDNDDMKPNLWIVNSSGDKIGSGRKKLNIETWADKCTYSSSDDIYCAVPEYLEKGSGLLPELAENTIDRIYKIDTKTGIKKMIAIPNSDHNISSVMVSEDEKYLYFTDSKTEKIHKLNLK